MSRRPQWLTKTEKRVALGTLLGLTSQEIADLHDMQVSSVTNAMSRGFHRHGYTNRAQLIGMSVLAGYITRQDVEEYCEELRNKLGLDYSTLIPQPRPTASESSRPSRPQSRRRRQPVQR